MELRFDRRPLVRRHSLAIARGRFGTTENLFVTVAHDGLEGVGEAAAVDHGPRSQDAASAEAELSALAPRLAGVDPGRVVHVGALAREASVASAARAALDMACWDWLGRRAGLPLYRLLGLDAAQPPTSVTVGIESPETVAERVEARLAETGARVLKLKLGGEDGPEADRARYVAAHKAADAHAHRTGHPVALRVDANGGWSTEDAVALVAWLADNGCEYVEQPLAAEADPADLERIRSSRRLPIVLDEPIFDAADVARLAPHCDGVNVKVMKSGGLTEALRAIHTARAHGLCTMLGCFGESALAIGAAAALGALLDWVDLDSHLNLDPDPAEGPALVDGRLVPPERPGHGGRLRDPGGSP